MSDLVDVKLPKKSKTELKELSIPTPFQDEWPYGLKLTFERKQFEKIPVLSDLKMGQKVTVKAEGSVISLSMSEQQGAKGSKTLEIQIEKIAVDLLNEKKPEEMSMKEFRAMREGKS